MPPSESTFDEAPTTPDPIDPRALTQVRSQLLFGEHIARCWRTAVGFLVMTNLRCIHAWRKLELFGPTEWHAGPSFFFYNLATPRVVGGRFLELSEELGSASESARFLLHDAASACEEIDRARAAGRAEWAARRSSAQHLLGRPLRPAAPPPGTTLIVREVVKVRCSYCGNLVDVADGRCPFCGAPLR
jgi:rubrerythrin